MTGRAAAVTAVALALAGCEEPTTNTATADVGNAARAAQTDIDEYTANRAAATTFVPPVAPTPRPPAQQAQAITPDDVLDEEAPERPGNSAARP